MKKLDITKKGTGIFQGKKNLTFNKTTGWPLLIGLLLMLITASAFVTAGGKMGTPPKAKAKSVTGKARGTALLTGPPTISYTGPQVYHVGQAVSLTPASSGVGTLAYNTTGAPYGGHFKQPGCMTTDAAGNLYVTDQKLFYVQKIPAGNANRAQLSVFATNGMVLDAAGDFYLSDRQEEYIFFDPENGGGLFDIEDVWRVAADSVNSQGNSTYRKLIANQPIEDVYSAPFGLAVSAPGNVFVSHDDDHSLLEFPAGSSKFNTLYQYNNYIAGVIACDVYGNVFFANATGITQVPAGHGALVHIPGSYANVKAITLNAGGDMYLIDNFTGQLEMLSAGNLSGTPMIIGPRFTNPSGVAVDGAGNAYVSSITGDTTGFVSQVKPTGGYFISPTLPAGMHFDNSTGIISGSPTAASAVTNYTITAYNSSGSTTATVSIQVVPGPHDADLVYMAPTRTVLEETFLPATTSYTATVANDVASITITPTTASADATVKINGIAVADKTASAPIALAEGVNTINVVVTARDGIATKTYTLVVTRQGNSNDNLSTIARSAGVLSPTFSPSTLSYTTSVVNVVRSMTITPTASDQAAKISVNGHLVASGTASAPIPLAVGTTTINISVTATNGTTSKTYSITVTRAGSANDNLSAITPSAGTLSPGFSASNGSYTLKEANEVKSITITPTAADPDANIKVNGTSVPSGSASAAIPLAVGSNTISVTVLASNGTTTKTYTITVTRAGSTNDSLSGITLSTGTLSPVFAATTTGYTATVPFRTTSVTVTSTLSDPEATIKVKGAAVASGSPSAPIALYVGSNTINIFVTGSDGKTSQAYTITVTRAAPTNNDNLSDLTLSTGPLSPAFAAATTSYSETVPYRVAFTTVTPTLSNPEATLKVNGITQTSGTASAPIALAVGVNTIHIAVTASDGTTSQTYTITITRPPASNNDDLTDLTTSVGTLSPAFASGTTDYIVNGINGPQSITVTPTAADPGALIQINGSIVVSGTASTPISFSPGATIEIDVIATNGATKIYTLTGHVGPNSNDRLLVLRVGPGTLSPTFAATTTSYTVNGVGQASTINISPSTSDAGATLTVNGTVIPSQNSSISVPLSVGSNTINIGVTASDGITSQTYTLNVTRSGSNNANLVSLKISKGTLSPSFTGTNTSYTASVVNGVTSVVITPTTANAGATITVNGTSVASGSPSGAISLSVGNNTVTTVVTAQDGTTTKTYTVVFTRAAGPINIPDASLSVSQQPVSPPVEDDVILVHQGISPNGDGINDYLVIEGIQAYPDNKLFIMNRNGALVFEAKGYDNASKVFDGHSSKTGQIQLPGTYFYQLDYTVNGITKHKTGYLVLKY